jgi:ATP-dependent RNA helicase DDX35
LELLYSLKALDEYGRLTNPLGMSIAEAPIDPMISTMLLASLDLGCAEEALTIAAMLTVSNAFYSPRHKKKDEILKERAHFAVEEGTKS